ncbi:MAG TPA: metal ABC transporter permease [Ktedonobacteraceae bacterium]|nr:metal ABC transporter permease [Ktedonobacteraceae bacterium]
MNTSIVLLDLPTLSWNLVADWQDIFQYGFMRNAFLAGTIIAIIAGTVGYFVVLRGLAFASHTLANIGFAGAAGAVLIGLQPVYGLLVFTLVGGLGMSAFGKRLSQRDITVGIILSVALGLGILFISLYQGYSTDAYAVLFGEVLGISQQDVLVALVVGGFTLLALGTMYRPLLFASLDEQAAEAKGAPVQLMNVAFMLVLALAVAEAVQIVGVLLIFALLVTPAAIAERLATRPPMALLLSVLLALLFTWGGLVIAYYLPYPLGFFITTLAFGTYLVVRLVKDGPWRFNRGYVAAQNTSEGGAS